jgi:1-acyl-sn-glycerol-3-phosphate acyltransferase
MAFSRPTKEQLGALSRMERVAYSLGDLTSRHFSLGSAAYNSVVMSAILWATASNRLRIHGLEHIKRFGKKDIVLIVANHRTFFDFFVVCACTFWNTKMTRRIIFPVRSNFFYDHPLGPMINVAMSGMTMFPPLLRNGGIHRRATFNEYSIQRSIEELTVPGTMMGLHPEGTRNKNDDPYTLLRARSGVGRIGLASPQAHIIPAFLLGMGNQLQKEFGYNWFQSKHTQIDAMFGPEIDLSDLRAEGAPKDAAQKASERMLDGIAALAKQHKETIGLPKITG